MISAFDNIVETYEMDIRDLNKYADALERQAADLYKALDEMLAAVECDPRDFYEREYETYLNETLAQARNVLKAAKGLCNAK
jgi:hypothetical protein